MRRTLAVLLRAPLAMGVVLIAGALLGAVTAIPASGLANAFNPGALAAGMTDSLPWAVSLSAWYLAIVSARRIKSRLASHALVFSISFLFMSLGLSLAPLVAAPAATGAPPIPLPRRFLASGELTLSAEEWDAPMARGVLVVDPAAVPRMAWYPEAAWSPSEGLVRAGGVSYRLALDALGPASTRAAPLVRAGGKPSDWISDAGKSIPLLLMALSFAALASGVRFPARMFSWPMPGAMLGLLFAWTVPGLYGVLGSASITGALELVGISLEPEIRAAILATAIGLLLLGADLLFRPADEIRGRADA